MSKISQFFEKILNYSQIFSLLQLQKSKNHNFMHHMKNHSHIHIQFKFKYLRHKNESPNRSKYVVNRV